MSRLGNYVGQGLYTLPQAARLVGVNIHTLRYWIGDRSEPPVIARALASERLLTFAELMELHFIKMFRTEGVTLPAIRKASIAASKKFRATYPFIVKRFDTDGRTIFSTLQDKETDKELVEDLAKGQLVFEQIIKPFFRRLEYGRTDDLQRYWPLEKSGRVVLDPARRFGQPIDAQTGVPVEAITTALKAGNGQDAKTVAKWFGVPLEAVKAAITFDRSLAS